MIKKIIQDFAKKYRWHYEFQKDVSNSPEENINSGLCDLFADEVKKHFPETIIHYDDDLDHYYCEIDGRFYDAENPSGVSEKGEMVFLGKIIGDP